MGLAVVGVALGVAVVVSIDLANASASRAFTLSTEAVTGRTTHQVTGGPAGLPDAVFRRLVLDAGIDRAAPIVEEYVLLGRGEREPGRVLHLLGVDPFSERPFRSYLSAGSAQGDERGTVDLGPLLTRPGAGVLPAATARELGFRPGDTFRIRVGGGERTVELVGVLEPADENTRRALADLLVTDIATAQELLGRVGRLDRIDLIVPAGPGNTQEGALLRRARSVLPPGSQITEAGARARSTEEMTRAFRLNLTALSLLSLVCGVFLIYNTMVFSVVQRRTLLGTLRALGVSRREVFTLVLGEALLVGVVGTGAGLAAGVVLGRGLVRLVTQTINDLYFVVSVQGLSIAPVTLVKGAAIGLGATLLAALAPAIEATLAPPRAVLTRSTLEARLRRVLPRVTLLGAGLLVAGGLLLVPRSLVVSFGGLFAVILGCALLAPGATVLLMRLLRRPMGAAFGVLGRMAAGGVVSSLSRTAVAIAALVIAVSVTVGVGVMIDSFRRTVVRWLEMSLQADVYVAAPSRAGGFRGAPMTPGLPERAAAVPGVARVNTIRRVEVLSSVGPVRLVSAGSDAASLSRAFELREGDPREAWPAFLRGEAVLVSEPFSRRHDTEVGSRLQLRTLEGMRGFRVAGIYYDYASDQGTVLMSRPAYLRFFKDAAASGFSLELAPGADLDATIRRLRTALAGEAVAIQSNRSLKRVSLEIFDRTFRITGVLRLLAGLVAFIGVLASLMALQLERSRELGVLRANGLTPGQVWHLVTSQTGLMGLAAGLLSIPVGLLLAAIMVFVINRRSFGWTIRMIIAPEILLQALLLALAAALLAGLYPAWKMARTSPAVALREE